MARKPYKYGDKTTSEIVAKTVLDLEQERGRPVSVAESRERVLKDYANFNPNNLGPDLSVLAVNSKGRVNFRENSIPRRTHTKHKRDKLFRTDDGNYMAYDPARHGIWELTDTGNKKLEVRFVGAFDGEELDHARETAFFDIGEDVRNWTLVTIAQRDGQPAFRKALLAAYSRRCAISGCAVPALLEAAHIVPFKGKPSNVLGNGLLLRTDLHKLFDLHLLGIDPITRTIRLGQELHRSEYAGFEGKRLREPDRASVRPREEALSHHFERCILKKALPVA